MTKNSISLGRVVAGVCMILAIAAVVGLLGSFAPSNSNKGGTTNAVIPNSPIVNNSSYVVDESFVPSSTTIYAGTYRWNDTLTEGRHWEKLDYYIEPQFSLQNISEQEESIFDRLDYDSQYDLSLKYQYYNNSTLQYMTYAYSGSEKWDTYYSFFSSLVNPEDYPNFDFELVRGYGQFITVQKDTVYTSESGLAFVEWFYSNVKSVYGVIKAGTYLWNVDGYLEPPYIPFEVLLPFVSNGVTYEYMAANNEPSYWGIVYCDIIDFENEDFDATYAYSNINIPEEDVIQGWQNENLRVISVLEDTIVPVNFMNWFYANTTASSKSFSAIDSPTTVACILAVDSNMCYVSTNKKGLLCA